MVIDRQDAAYEHLNELRLAAKYESDFPNEIFFEFGRWHDHSCCPDCCGCANEYSQFLTIDEYMRS